MPTGQFQRHRPCIQILYGEAQPEKCTLDGDEINCVEQFPELEYYDDYPELLLVRSNYGQHIETCL